MSDSLQPPPKEQETGWSRARAVTWFKRVAEELAHCWMKGAVLCWK